MDLTKHKDELFESFTLFSILLMTLVVFATTISTKSPLLFVFIAFLPTITTMILALILYEEAKFHKIITWLIPIILAGTFYFTIDNLYLLKINFDLLFITLVNLILSLLYVGTGYLLLKLLSLKEAKSK
jgi:hypothetical protein